MTTLVPNQISDSFSIKPKEFKYFNLKVEDYEFKGGEDLIIKVQPTQEQSQGDPDVFISKVLIID